MKTTRVSLANAAKGLFTTPSPIFNGRTYKYLLFCNGTEAISYNPSSCAVTAIILNRPKQKNALSLEMYDEWTAAMNSLSLMPDSSCKAVILTGCAPNITNNSEAELQSSFYSSGNDLSNFSQLMHPRKMAAQGAVVCENFVNCFVNMQKPLIVAFNGSVIGLPMTVAGLADYRISIPQATFHTPFKALGQAPEGCSSYMFEQLMGKENAKRLLDDGEKVTASQLKEMGFLSEIVTAGMEPVDGGTNRLMARALEIANSPQTVRFTKGKPELVKLLRDVNKHECKVLEEAWVSPECFTALSAFLESRKKPFPAAVLRAMNLTRPIWDRK